MIIYPDETISSMNHLWMSQYHEDQWQDILLVGRSRHNLLVMVFTHRQTNGLYIYMIIMKAMTYERDDVMK
jgi:hypothetical protein